MMDGHCFAPETLPAMREHYANCRTIGLVLHASHPDERDEMESLLAHAFRELGNHEVKSVHRFSASDALPWLESVEGVFVGGGETFGLLRELNETGQLELIRNRILAGMPYGGSSAGGNMTGQVIGTTNDFPVTDIPSRRALGVLPVVINPHHPRVEAEAAHAERMAKIQNYLKWNPDERVLALGDRAMVRLHEEKLTVKLGPVWDYSAQGRLETVEGQELALPPRSKS
jgi:dipeptidase E